MFRIFVLADSSMAGVMWNRTFVHIPYAFASHIARDIERDLKIFPRQFKAGDMMWFTWNLTAESH